MSVEALLARLSRLGISIELDGPDRLAIEGPDDKVEAEIETIRTNKPAIIAHLRSRQTETASRIRTVPTVPPKQSEPPPVKPTSPAVPVAPKVPAPPPKPRMRLPKVDLGPLKTKAGQLLGRAPALATGAFAGARTAYQRIADLTVQRFAPMAEPAGAPRVLADALPYQSDLTAIIEEPPPRHMRMTAYILAGFVTLAVLIASIVEIDVVVRGTGKLTVDGPPVVLQPIERAILRSLHVKPGDIVTKGQVLATLDPTFAEADVTAIETQHRMMTAQLRRLEAESRDEPYLPESQTVEEALQVDIFRQRRQEYASRLRAFDEDLKRAQAAVRTLDVERGLLEQQLVVARDVEQMRSSLLASQSGSRLQYLEARSVRIRAERDHQMATDRLVELRHDLDAKRAERQAFVDEWRRRTFEEMERLRAEAARVDGAQAKARRFKELVVIAAPKDGVVIDIARRSVGSVLKEAETLIMLAPTDMPLIAEVSLASADVGYAKAGDSVIVKVDTFPYTRHGSLKGTLRAISQESFSPNAGSETGQPPVSGHANAGSFHRAQIVLTDLTLERLPEGARLIPGLTVSADIKVGMRTIMSYFMTPLVRGFDESLREP
jgi:HlyD family secretion protein